MHNPQCWLLGHKGTEGTGVGATLLQQVLCTRLLFLRAEEWTEVVVVGQGTAELAQKEKHPRKWLEQLISGHPDVFQASPADFHLQISVCNEIYLKTPT